MTDTLDATMEHLMPFSLQVGDAPRSERPRQPGGVYKPIQPHEIVFIDS